MPPENAQPASNGAASAAPMDALASLFATQDLGVTPESQQQSEPEEQDDTQQAGADEGDAELEIAGDGEDVTVEPDEAHDDIPAPAGLSADDLTLWAKLPPDAKRIVAEQSARQTADYTRKTSEAARQRQEAEALRSTWEARVQGQLQFLGGLAQTELAPPDPALAKEDPFDYAEKLGQYQAALHEREKARAHYAKLSEELAAHQEQQRKAWEQAEGEKLLKEIPAFADPEKGPALALEVKAYAKKQGVTPEQFRNVSALELKVLHKAMLYDRAVEKAKAQAKTAGGKPTPAAAPGRLPGTQGQAQTRTKQLTKAHKESGGSLQTMAAIWGEHLKGT